MNTNQDITNNQIDSTRLCTRCKGSGITHHDGFTSLEGKIYPERNDPCYACRGAKSFMVPNWKEILNLITKPSKTGKRAFRKSKPDFVNEHANRNEGRAYFVWRLVRFHGGADVTMPVCAMGAITGDPYEPELDYFASELAKRFFGTDMAAAYRWAGALGHNVIVPDSMPASAHSCGPVADENKPEMETMELL